MCFPKDVSAFISMGRQVDYPTSIAEAVDKTNQRQRRAFAQRVLDYFGEHTGKTTLAVWGLAFKGRTDDVREAPAIDAVRMFMERGMTIRAHDPEAIRNARRILGTDGITYFENGYEAADGADALVVFTDWPEFRAPDFEGLMEKLSQPVIFDGRNLYDPIYVSRIGFEYHSVGRPTATAEMK